MREQPSVKHLSISEERKQITLEEVQNAVQNNSLSRELVKTTFLERSSKENLLNVDFKVIGINIIMDKIWFVDNPPGDSAYSYHGTGSHFGNSIANGETKGVIDKILEGLSKADNVISYEKELDEKKVDEAIHRLTKCGFTPTIILTNIYDSSLFWDMQKFKGNVVFGKGTRHSSGKYLDLKVFSSNFVPKGVTIIYDKDKLGELLIKKDITCDLTEKFDYIKTIEDLNLTEDVLPEKVNFTAQVTVGFTLFDYNAGILLKSDSANETKIVKF